MKRFSLFLVTLITQFGVFAQSNSETNSSESPTASNSFLNESHQNKGNEDVGVNLYSGALKVNLPIFDLKSKDISIPISLSYIGGKGIKIQDFAKPTGLGWQLSAGGYISRMVRDFPDENQYGYLSASSLNGHDIKDLSTTGITSTGSTNVNNLQDGEPDEFFVNTPSFAFHFSFDENGTPVIPNNTGYKVISNIYHVAAGTTITFNITDPNGNQYYFGSYPSTQDNLTTDKTIYMGSGVGEHHQINTFPSNWYLDKIVSFNSKDVVDLNYSSGSNYSVNNYNYQAQSFYFNNSYYQLAGNFLIGKSTNYNAPKYLSSIVTTLGEADFEYSFDRLDLPAVGRLNSITIKGYNTQTQLNSTNIKKFKFFYDYFGTPSTNANELRLKLSTVSFTDNTLGTANNMTLYSFDYNTSNNLPSRQSPQYDYWGYYNFNSSVPNNTGSLVPYAENRNPSLAGSTANILTSIHYVTGSSTQIQYEQNTYFDNGNQSGGGLRVKQITKVIPVGTNIETNYLYNEANGNSTGLAYGYNDGTNFTTFFNLVSNLTGNYGPEYIPLGYPDMPAWSVETLSQSDFNTYDIEGNFIGYTKVKEVNSNGGYSTNTFSNFVDFQDIYAIYPQTTNIHAAYPGQCPAPVITAIPPGKVKAIDYNYKRGLLLNKSTYNSSDNKISELTNTYSSLSGSTAFTSYGIHGLNYYFGHTAFGGPRIQEFYKTPIDNYRLVQTIEKKYDQFNQNNYVTNTTTFTYSPNQWQVNTISTTDSKGVLHNQTIYHTDDINIPMLTSDEVYAINLLHTSNNLNAIIHKIETKNSLVNELHNSYNTISAKTYLVNTSAINNGNLVKKQFFQYETSTSNLVSFYDIGNNITSKSYGYNFSHPILTVENAGSNEYFYIGFEGTFGANFTKAHTGKGSYNASSTPYYLNFNLPNSRSYLVQWWNWDANLGKWQMNEQAYTGPINISGIIDDVRIFPVDAFISTTTYDPLLGMTSELDVNGVTTYYEYDAFNRLSVIRDGDKNVKKKFCYNYAGQTENCVACTFTDPIWQNTSTPLRCQLDATGQNTGYQEQEQVDINSCSQSYNQTTWHIVAQNTTACPMPVYVNLTSTNTYNTAGYVASYYNTVTGYTYTFAVSTATGLQALGTVPAGNYTLSITRPIGGVYTLFQSGCFKQSMTGTSATFYNVPVSTTTCKSITVTLNLEQ